MVKLLKIIANDPAHKSTTYLADDGKTYTLKGDLSQRANNPGNISPTGAKAKGVYEGTFGAIGYLPSSNGPPVAVFPDLSQGQAAQLHLWQTPAYQGKTLNDAAASWAGLPYADALSAAAGVSGDTAVSSLSGAQLQAVIAAQSGKEGSSNLTITDSKGTVIPAARFFSTVRQPNSVGSPDDRQAPTLPVMPPPPRPRPDPPGGFTAPPPLIPPTPQGTPWDIPGVLNVGKEMALKPDASGHYPTMASGYINRALNKAVQDAAPVIQQKVTGAGNAVSGLVDQSGIGNLFAGFGNAFNTVKNMLPEGNNYGLPGYSNNDVAPKPPHLNRPAVPGYMPAPPDERVKYLPTAGPVEFPSPRNYGTPGYSGGDIPAPSSSPDKAAADKAMKDFIAAAMASRSNYGLPGYSGNDVAPGTLPLPAPPPLVPPVTPPTLPTAPLGHPGTPPGTPLHMTTVPFIPPPPPPVRLASGNTAQVGATGSAQGGRYQYQVRPDGSVVNLTTGRVTAPATR